MEIIERDQNFFKAKILRQFICKVFGITEYIDSLQ